MGTLVKKKITAVDLITVVVFAVLYRVLWYFFKMAGVVFPFNHIAIYLFSSFCLIACWAIVRKPWASFYYTVAWCAINFFLQGEIPLYWVLVGLLPVIPELYLNSRAKSFDEPTDVYSSTKDLIIASIVYNVIYAIWNFAMIVKVFMIPVPTNLIILVIGLSVIAIVIGGFAGKNLGIKLKALLG